MKKQIKDEIYEDLKIGSEQVTSNECWEDTEENEPEKNKAFADLKIEKEQASSNECYGEEDEKWPGE